MTGGNFFVTINIKMSRTIFEFDPPSFQYPFVNEAIESSFRGYSEIRTGALRNLLTLRCFRARLRRHQDLCSEKLFLRRMGRLSMLRELV